MHNTRAWLLRWKYAPFAAVVCGALAACNAPTTQTVPSVQPVINITPLPAQNTAATEAALREEAIPTPVPREYTVQAGDSLWALAQRFNTTIEAIVALNNLKDLNILVGQKLLIPGGSVVGTTPLTNTGTTPPPSSGAP